MDEATKWIGLFLSTTVPLPQIWKLVRHDGAGVSIVTYCLLCLAMACWIIHAVEIGDAFFIISNSVNLTTNSVILVILLRRKYGQN